MRATRGRPRAPTPSAPTRASVTPATRATGNGVEVGCQTVLRVNNVNTYKTVYRETQLNCDRSYRSHLPAVVNRMYLSYRHLIGCRHML